MTVRESSETDARRGAAGGLRRARLAVAAVFGVHALLYSSFAVRVPTLKLVHGLSAGQLGLAIAGLAVTGLVGMQLAGGLVARFGSAPVLPVTMAWLSLALIGIGMARDAVQLTAAILLFGVADGLLDVCMNAHAVAVERALGRPILSSCHAAWSIGAMAGAAAGGAAIKASLSMTQHYLVLLAIVVALIAVARRYLLPASADRARRLALGRDDAGGGDGTGQGSLARRMRRGLRAGWSPHVVIFGALGAAALLAESAVANWSGVFLHENRGAPLALASLGYVGFTVCQTGGRLAGDRLHQKYGASVLVRYTSVIAMAGLAAVVLSPVPAGGIAGFALLGIGLSVLLPLIFGAVGHSGADSASESAAAALSKFTTLSYSGLLIGPVFIGWFANSFGLTAALSGLLVLMLGVMLSSMVTAVAIRFDSSLKSVSETSEPAMN